MMASVPLEFVSQAVPCAVHTGIRDTLMGKAERGAETLRLVHSRFPGVRVGGIEVGRSAHPDHRDSCALLHDVERVRCKARWRAHERIASCAREHLDHTGHLGRRVEKLPDEPVLGRACVRVTEQPVAAADKPRHRNAAHHRSRKVRHQHLPQTHLTRTTQIPCFRSEPLALSCILPDMPHAQSNIAALVVLER